MSTTALAIDVWSDVVCPWCAIGRARLKRAITEEGLASRVHVRHRAFELDPDAEGGRRVHDVLQERYGPDADVPSMMCRVQQIAASDQIDLHPAQAISANTFDAHRLLLWAQEQGKEPELMERLVHAHFVEHRDLGDHELLAACAAEVGLDAGKARLMLASDQFAQDVRRDETQARQLGIRGVPFFVLDGRLGVSGAQGVDAFREALRKALS